MLWNRNGKGLGRAPLRFINRSLWTNYEANDYGEHWGEAIGGLKASAAYLKNNVERGILEATLKNIRCHCLESRSAGRAALVEQRKYQIAIQS
jgi:hypothetical protein